MIVLGWFIFISLLIGYFACLILAITLDMDVLTQVNSVLPQDKQFPLIIGKLRSWELGRRYKALFPQGRLLARSRWLFGAAFACFFSAIGVFCWFHLSIRR